MTFAFVYHRLIVGGIETLMVRMSRWLVANGNRVVIIVRECGATEYLFDADIPIKELGVDFDALMTCNQRHCRAVYARIFPDGEHPDVFVAFSSPSLWVAARLLNASGPDAKICAGVWTPLVYSGQGLSGLFADPGSLVFFKSLTAKERIFANEQIRGQIEESRQRPLEGNIWPVPIDGKRFSTIKREPEFGRLVSIGRLSDMKTYNLWMLDIIHQLVLDGYCVSWHVYGDGPFVTAMEQKILEYGLKNHIFLHGTISYKCLGDVLRTSYGFIGMGTALIEAALCRIPCVPVVAYYSQPETYGYLHQLPGYTFGEYIGKPDIPVIDLVRRLLTLKREDYWHEADLCYEHAQRFALEPLMHRFVHIVDNLPSRTNIWCPRWFGALSTLLLSGYGVLRRVRKQG